MKIKTYAARFYADQISRIEEGFKLLGHQIIYDAEQADLLYSNDLNQADVAAEESKKFGIKYIQNLQDLPWHLIEKDSSILEKTREILERADKVTTISQTVQDQVIREFNLNSKIIYQPIKPVSNLNLTKNIEFLMVGRLNDPNKRAKTLGLGVINKFRERIPEVRAVTIGSEDIGLDHAGIVSDEKLNELYNRSKFVLCLGKIEGLNLPIVESICAGAIPICLSDSETSFEFAPHAFIAEPTVDKIVEKIQKLDYYYEDLVDGVCKPLAEIYSSKFSPKSVAARIIESLN